MAFHLISNENSEKKKIKNVTLFINKFHQKSIGTVHKVKSNIKYGKQATEDLFIYKQDFLLPYQY